MTINKTRLAKIVIYLVAWAIITILIHPTMSAGPTLSYSGPFMIWVFSGILGVAIIISLFVVFLIIGGLWEWLNDK